MAEIVDACNTGVREKRQREDHTHDDDDAAIEPASTKPKRPCTQQTVDPGGSPALLLSLSSSSSLVWTPTTTAAAAAVAADGDSGSREGEREIGTTRTTTNAPAATSDEDGAEYVADEELRRRRQEDETVSRITLLQTRWRRVTDVIASHDGAAVATDCQQAAVRRVHDVMREAVSSTDARMAELETEFSIAYNRLRVERSAFLLLAATANVLLR